MPCAAIAASSLLWLAAAPAPKTPEPPPIAAAVILEPLFADIVARATALKAQAEALRASGQAPGEEFKTGIAELAELDMAGQKRIRDKGVDGDLACILRGIAEDLPVKLAAVQLAKAAADRDAALREMVYLLNDNIEVVVTPPEVSSGVPSDGAI